MLDYSLLEAVFAGLFLATGLVLVYAVTTDLRTKRGLTPGPQSNESAAKEKVLPFERKNN